MSGSYPKGQDATLSGDFKSREFDCQCKYADCRQTLIDRELVEKLQAIRDAVGHPIRISSGYRCQKHQDELQASGLETAKTSQHLLGRAADILVEGKSGEELEKFARAAGFKAVGVARHWIHVDLRSDRDRAWTYSRS